MEENNKYTDDNSVFNPSENHDTYDSPETENLDNNNGVIPVDSQPYKQDYSTQQSYQPNYNGGQQPYQQGYTAGQPNYNGGQQPYQSNYNAGQQYSQQSYGTQTPHMKPYAQSAYGQTVYGQQANGGKPQNDGTGFGIASMVLGIISILLFCTCFNIITAIIAIIFGIIQLVKSKKKVFAIVGISTAAVSIILTIVFWIVVAPSISTDYYKTFKTEYPDLYEEFYNDTY